MDERAMSMNRRDFLQAAGCAAAGFAFSSPEHLLAGDARWRTFEVTTQIEVLKPSGKTRVWVPAALISLQRIGAGTSACQFS
jgi:hypothetical protein